MASTQILRATPADAALVGRMLHEFNAEFEGERVSAEALTKRFWHHIGARRFYERLGFRNHEPGEPSERFLCYLADLETPPTPPG